MNASSPSAFLPYDIFLAFTGQICAILVHYRREEKPVSLPKNQCSPQSPSVAVRAGDKRPLRRPVLGPPSASAVFWCPLALSTLTYMGPATGSSGSSWGP